MLNSNEYIAGWPDLPYPNFIAWIEGIESSWPDNTAILFRSGKQREFTRWSFTKYAGECRRIARGLLAAGLRRGDRVALWAENRPEWMAVWMGTVIAGLVIVPVDYLVSEEECANIINITRAGAFFYSPRKQEFADSVSAKFDFVKIRVCLNRDGETAGTVYYDAFGDDAADQELPGVEDIAERDPASIVFTSGTTGFAKGVTLHHRGIIANVSAAIRSLRAYSWDVFINVLPLHHTYPTTCSFLAPHSTGAASLIVEKLVGKVIIDDIRDAGGTFLIAVPLLYEKVKTSLAAGYNKLPGALRVVLDLLRRISLAKAKKGNYRFGQVALGFIRKKAGLKSIRIVVAGGGPLNPKTADFFDSFGFNIVQGYGMSENSPLISVSTPWHKNNVSVGLPVKYTSVKIINKNEEGIGEIAVKSPSIMLGYYENPEATKEMFTEDGYLKTGDLGFIDEQGFVYINGRAKNLIVSAGGKNIYPEEIEMRFEGSRVVGEILVVGRRERKFGGEQIVAVVVPNFEVLEQDHPGKSAGEAFINELVKAEIEKVNRTLAVYKRITDFVLRKDPFEKNAQQKIRRFMYADYAKAPE
jgi:long-chain acyl-CoA synthetase